MFKFSWAARVYLIVVLPSHKILLNYYLHFLTFHLLNKLRSVGCQNISSCGFSPSMHINEHRTNPPSWKWNWLNNKEKTFWLPPHSRLIVSFFSYFRYRKCEDAVRCQSEWKQRQLEALHRILRRYTSDSSLLCHNFAIYVYQSIRTRVLNFRSQKKWVFGQTNKFGRSSISHIDWCIWRPWIKLNASQIIFIIYQKAS